MKNVRLFTLFFFLLSAFTMQAQNTIRLNAGQRLEKGQKIEVEGKGYLILQDDGNLVAYDAANRARWASGTDGFPVTHVEMNFAGYLAIYNDNGGLVWFSGTDKLFTNTDYTYFEIDLTTWSAFIFSEDGSKSKELFTGTLMKSLESVGLRGGAPRILAVVLPVVQADGTLAYPPTLNENIVCKVVINKLYIPESKPKEAFVERAEEPTPNTDPTTGVLVSSPGKGPENIKVVGKEYFKDHVVTFFCQAGYVSRFELSYDHKGQKKTFTTNDLPVGQTQSFKVPYDATNIVAKGFMLSAGVHPIFNEKLSAPADVCYKTYGTIFDRRWTKCN